LRILKFPDPRPHFIASLAPGVRQDQKYGDSDLNPLTQPEKEFKGFQAPGND
jgi:hypothetical protein